VAYFFFRYNLFPLLWLRVKKIEGLENLPEDTNFIVAANHNSWIDSPILGASLFYKIKKKMYFLAASRKWSWLGTLPISKKDKGKILEKALKLLDKGNLICLFPEGKSNPKKTLLDGKTGAARLALWSKKLVIPVGIKGTEITGNLKSFLSFWMFWRQILVRIGKPLDFNEFFDQEINKEILQKVTYKIMGSIAELCDKKMPVHNP